MKPIKYFAATAAFLCCSPAIAQTPGFNISCLDPTLWYTCNQPPTSDPYIPENSNSEIAMEAFWKNTPIIDRWMKSSFLTNLPGYLSDTDFPPQETDNVVPFATGISTVRILGGWNPSWDNGEAGEVGFVSGDVFDSNVTLDKEKLFARLSRFVEAGITDITIVTDQIPESLTINPVYVEPYGQISPPKDASTSWLIGNRLATALKQEFPTVKFRYRVGTEAGGRGRFDGTQNQYFVHYTRIADGINKYVGADIEIMPYNASGITTTDVNQNVSIIEIAPQIASTNRKISAQPTSLYVITPDSKTFNATIESRLSNMMQYWDSVDAAYGQEVDREIHEFGLIDPTGALIERGLTAQNAAFHAEAIMRFAQAGIDKLYHWGDTIRFGQLAPTGWLYSVLDSMEGGVWEYPSIEVWSGNADTTYFAAVSKKDDKSILLISALNPDIDIVEYKTPNTRVPLSSLPTLNFAPASSDICMTWVRDSLGAEIRNNPEAESKAIESLTLESLEEIEKETPGTIRNNVFVQGDDLIIRPFVKTNTVTAIVFEANCEN